MLDPIPYLRTTAADLGPAVESILERVLAYPGFTTWTGSLANRHHYGEGGLLRHTAEVVHLCMTNADTVEVDTGVKLSRRVLFLAALCHDVGKTHDYRRVDDPMKPGLGWEAVPHHRHIHHINRSAVIWTQLTANGVCADVFDEVLHCILSHHGSPDRGSPVLPQTREAWVLHLCDALSAWMDGVGKMDPKP